MRLGRFSVLSVIMLLSVLVLFSGQSVHASTSNATITTDQSDYLAGSTVTIYGSAFSPTSPVTVSVTDPNSVTTTWSVASSSSGGFTTAYMLDHVFGNYLVFATDGVNSASTIFHDANEAANISQCTNGGVGATPEPCDIGTVGASNLFPGGTFSNWVNGNSNGGKSHWQEGDGIPYRVIISGLTAGTHNLTFTWDVVHSGGHALDYIESANATETFSTLSTSFHFNNNDPCQDQVTCTPASPVSSTPIPAFTPANGCGGAGGTFTGTQNTGKIYAWGAGTTLTSFAYASQNVPSGTGQCSSSGILKFTTASGTTTIVVAWAGHIASQANWGVGNSASSINGSPYHTSLDSLDGATVGSQDRALATTAIFFTPSITTAVKNSAGTTITGTTVPLGTSIHDTATLSGASSSAGGTVTYKLYTGTSCSGTPPTIGPFPQTVSVTNGVVPDSSSYTPAAGTYSFNATYSGDSIDFPKLPNSVCETFTIAKAPTTISTTVVFKNGTPITSPIPLGSIVNDTAVISGQVAGFPATGSVTYRFFTTNTCTGTFTSQSVTVSGGLVPHSNQQGPLAAGQYSFNATYSGDSNYIGSTSSCEPFQVSKAPSSIATAIHVAPSGTTDVTGTTQPLGTSLFDTATVTGTPFIPTGFVNYSFFTNGLCTAPASSAQTEALSSGLVPNSSPTGSLKAGSYSFQAVYFGDPNYNGSTSSCEPITIAKANTSTATTVFDASSNSPWSGSESTGASAYDTATVSASPFTATGTVTYTFFTNNACSGSGSSAGTVTLTATGSVPNSNTEGTLVAGSYSFIATYSGDSNYSGSTSGCEPFTVQKGTSSTSTTVFDAATNVPWSGSETTGASAYDTASLSTSDGFTATGTVSYTFFNNNACSGTGAPAGTVTLTASGAVPNSSTEGPLAAGSYSFQAVYSGDSNYSGSVSPCEPFTFGSGSSSASTIVFDASTNAPWTGSETTGASAYDTASVTPSAGFTATGTVSYTLFTNNVCTGSGASAGTVTLTGSGSVPNSNTVGPLMAGSYSFRATYSGDSNYSGSTSPCEPFTVNRASSSILTSVFDTSTNAPWSFSETTGASAYDTAHIFVTPFAPTGSVTYTFFNGSCGGLVVSTQTVTLGGGGMIPNSNPTGPLMSGNYAFQASYSGDPNYTPSTSFCEPFTVRPGASQVSTTVFDAATNSPWNSETTGASAYDMAHVSVSGPFPLTGTVTFTFYQNGCGGAVVFTQTVPLSGMMASSHPTGPLTAGSYAFQATYNGDPNYTPSTSQCEPFTVNIGSSTTTTAVFDAATNAPWSGGETTGASAYDTASVSTSDGFTATGTVTYTFFNNLACNGPGSSAGTLTLSASGTVPNSNTEGPLAAGSYSFQAVYSGDSNYSGSTSSCEPFAVSNGSSTTTTVVFDASTNVPWSGTETTGASAYDTANVTPSDGFVATGTVSYTFFANNACSGSGSSAGTVTLTSSGSVPNSSTEGPLTAGSYSFQAVYSGDSNYSGSTSPCEPFTVNIGSSTTTTAVFDASTNGPWTGTETTGASAYDTASVAPSAGFTATGTVSYTFYKSGDCSGTGSSAGTVTLTASGSVPNSSTEGPLAAGSYSFQAAYSGGSNYSGSTSACEPFTVNIGSSTTTTAVFDAATNAPWSGTETTGASAYDTANVTPSDGFVATGTVSYTFYTGGACSSTGVSAGTVTLSVSGSVPSSSTEGPLMAGSYSFEATYSGDSNYSGSTSSCEPFNVNIGSSTTATVAFDASTNAPWAGTETTGASAYDTATVSASLFTATGTVTYTLYTSSDCSGTGASAGTVTLTASGSVPNSNPTGPLMAGSYSFQATYSGDSNYSGSTSPCEPFSVAKGSSMTNTVVFDASTNGPWTNTETTGASAYDTAHVSAGPFPLTGTVTFTFYQNGCGGAVVFTQTVPLSGMMASSHPTGPLTAGSYAFQATYNGDPNYTPSTSQCEPFNVRPGSSQVSTTVFDATTNAPWTNTETTGASAYDTAHVSVSDPFPPTGTVTFTFYNGGCSSGVVFTQTVPLSGMMAGSHPTGPLMAGSYAFQATYNGDPNYNPSTSQCEPFTVNRGSSATATVVFDAATNAAWTGTETTGASAYDTASVSTSDGFTASGTVSYNFFSGDSCTGTDTAAGAVTLTASGSVPNSNTEGPLMAGSYSFQATYSGDSNYSGSTSSCEPFTVNIGSSTTATTVFDASTNAPWAGTETTGASAYDTASVSTSDGFTATGTVSYTFFSNNSCSGSGSSAGTVTLTASGSVPNSNTEGPLTAGSYSFQATYSGDNNYSGSTSPCEPLNINIGSSTTVTVVFDASTNAPWTNTETTGASAYDTAHVIAGPFPPTGTVTFTFYQNGCGGPIVFSQTVPLSGVMASSHPTGPLTAGSYAFQATFNGDSNYTRSTSQCEPFNVRPGTSQVSTTVFDASTNAPWTNTETTGASAYDTAHVSVSGPFPPTGTVTYTFYKNGCGGMVVFTQPVTLGAGGMVPNSHPTGPLMAGSYAFQASYSGDSNYAGSTSACEPFNVQQGTSQTATVVFDASTSAPWSGTETTGASAYDTASVTTSDGFVATGTVSYTFFSGGSCTGTGVSAGTVTLTGSGSVPKSSTEGPLAAGSYSFHATYSGDSNYSGSTSPCEPFTVNIGSSTTSTAVFDAATNAPWSGAESTGASAYDTAIVTPSDGFIATGTVTYTFYATGDCTGAGSSAGTVTLTATGAVPNSSTEGPLKAGSYSFQATYNGDTNYSGSTSSCEPFTVNIGSSTTATVVFDALTNAPWAGTETTGASAYDTASVSTSDGFTATGSVTYTFFNNGSCIGTGTTAGTVTLTSSGSVPNSSTQGPLAAGSYSFQATYSGDSNYSGSISPCEPFTLIIESSTTATTVFDAITNAPWTNTETTGSSAYDTSSVTAPASFTATGTVSYTFFSNNSCSGSGSSAGTVTLTASGAVPNSNTEGPLTAGSYSFQATYSGDSNYAGSTSACEPFAVHAGTSQIGTVVSDASTNAPWTGSETTGAQAYDTATVTTSDGFTATGSVSYTFFTNHDCSGTGTPAGTVTLTASGSVPNSGTEGPLAAGNYAFQAIYSGDSNYAGSTSPCEPFTVSKASSNVMTTVFDASTNAPWTNTETTGASAYDTAHVSVSGPFPPAGTVTFTFYQNGCGGAVVFMQTVPLSGVMASSHPTGPLTAGNYAFQATYNGDPNYTPSTSPCEPFTVNKGPSNVSTIVFDASTNAPWTDTETTGASAYDTAHVSVSGGPIMPTGTVTYTFYRGGCSGSIIFTQTVTLGSGGSVPNSHPTNPLMAGNYAFQASFSGDPNYNPSTSPCEPFTVKIGSSATATVVFDASTNSAWSGTESTGASAYDTASVTASASFTATGTVSYNFFANGTCSGTGSSAGTVTLTATGAVPSSNTEGPLNAGSYSFQAIYSGDSNYAGSTSPCEPFTVNKGTSTTATVVFDASTNAPWAGTEIAGASAYDTASVATSNSIIATGTVTYTFFTNSACSGSGASAGTVTLTATGTVPNSNTKGPLGAGNYGFSATYSGDSNYNGSTSSCEPFSVLKATPTISTQVSPSTITVGSSTKVNDTATISNGYNPTGTITFRVYFDSSTCVAGSLVFTSSAVTVNGNGSYKSTPPFTPTMAGTYYWVASYSGDANNNAVTTACGASGEILSVNMSQVTDTSFCPIPQNQFPLNLVTDPKNPGSFELVSTNPGQFYDNVFFMGTPGAPVTLTIGMPFPFVTQGAVPIQVSSSFGLVNGCFQPSFDATGQFTITATGGTLSSSGAPIIILTDYPTQQLGSYVYITVTGNVPSTGLVYVTVHMNYGLRGQDFNKITSGISSGTPPVSCTTNPCAQWTANPSVVIGSPQPYPFTVTGALTTSYTVTSINNFKKDPGFAGVVTDANGKAIAGATVKVYDSNGNLVGIATTDINGVYLLAYKYTGPSTTFTIKVILPTGVPLGSQTVTMKSNQLAIADFGWV